MKNNRFLITNVYSTENKGDAAIVEATIASLRNSFPGSHITVSSMTSNQSYEIKPNTIVTSIFREGIYNHNSNLARIIATTKYIVATLLWVTLRKISNGYINLLPSNQNVRALLMAYLSADAILPIGGGYLLGRNNLHDSFGLFLHLYAIWLGTSLAKPVILMPQSIGPFGNRGQELITRYFLNKTKLIFVRESLTHKRLAALGIDKPAIYQATDTAFLYNSPTPPHTPMNKLPNRRRPLVGITVREWLNSSQQEKFEREIAVFINSVSKQCNVIVIPQTTAPSQNDDDRRVGERVEKKLRTNHNIVFLKNKLSLKDISFLYASVDFLIGTRMHSNILALSSHVPVIAIAYEPKTTGIMKDLGLGKWTLPMTDVNHVLLEDLFLLLKKEKGSYLSQLDQKLPDYQKLALLPFSIIRRLLSDQARHNLATSSTQLSPSTSLKLETSGFKHGEKATGGKQ